MTVFGNSGKQQVFPVNYEAEVSQRLVDAAHVSDLKRASECIADPFIDVNFIGAVSLKAKRTEVVLHDEAPHEVRVEYEEFKTDVTALFLAAHAGNLTLVRKSYSEVIATTAAVRECHLEILDVLIKAGASQEACEEALLEASYLGEARSAELLMSSDLIRPQVAVHALVSACCRGFVNVVDTLIKCRVDVNAIDRVLLQSSKPSLYANVDCNALAAAVVSRQIHVVRLLLQAGAKTDIKVRLGAWSWDMDTGEEFRVGAGLAEAYCITWCAVEYFEASGAILRMLFRHLSPNTPHFGRTLLHHAILCNNARAVEVLLNCAVDKEFPVKTTSKTELRPIHLAAKLGCATILQCLITGGCNVNSKTASGETALTICVRYKHEEGIKVLASEGADFGLVNSSGQCATSIAKLTRWSLGFQQAVIDVIRAGKVIRSSNASIFSPLMFVTQANNVEALKKLIERADIDLDEQDDDGNSAAMIAAASGHTEAFRLLLHAGANIKLQNKHGKTAISLSESNHNGEIIEKVMLEYALEEGHNGSAGFYALHRAARRGDLDLVRMLISRGYDVNDMDGNETALSLARKNGYENDAERVILDEMALTLVLAGTCVKKHTKCGKGSPHYKVLKMVESAGILRWGKSNKRNVICRAAEVGPSAKFRWNRRNKFDIEEAGMFHVVTIKNKELHFVCQGGIEMAQLWVRGIKLLTRQAIFGKKQRSVSCS
ncbi:hypothetical protein Pint_23689 [Pistacia integerrima]|uniref:Uncharacterized protein n=1 Tax=Pistacia integerrima TaxID=434235 RepID=A0ACC0YL86_9ROSI|nr:hypothetical protein Pint_23689 [Pistacia integerrima]